MASDTTVAIGPTGAKDYRKLELDENDNLKTIAFAALVPKAYDYIALTYVAVGDGAGEIETVVYKSGGASGTTVATLTLAYDGSDRLSSVTKT